MLKRTLKTVSLLRQQIDTFYDEYKEEIRYDRKLNTCFKDFITEADATIERLENPLITIATVGTTSSGKSTILNGFTGRDIAPCNIDEMSAGILTFTPSNSEHKLIIKESPEGYWNGKTYTNVSDDEMRKEIERIFGIYKSKKIHKNCTAPQIEVIGEFLWNKFPEIIDAPEGIKFRFIDLPGLRRDKGDRKNLKVIQDVLKDVKPLSVLAMDYTCLATPEALETLLTELTETIKNLGGSTESIIFLLNKVDLYNEGQATTLSDDIEKFRKRVIAKLSSEMPKYNFDNIKIFPYIGILHNNAQISIGLQHHVYSEKIVANKELLSRLNSNCCKVFDNTENDDIYDFFNGIKRNLRKKEPIENEDIKKLIAYSYELSYANSFISELKRRIQESFYEIVIYPSIFRLQQKFQLLNAYLNNFLSVNRLSNQIQIHSRIFGILESQVMILGVNEEQRPLLVENLDSIIKEIKNIPTSFNQYLKKYYEILGWDFPEDGLDDFFIAEEHFFADIHMDNKQRVLESLFNNNEDVLNSVKKELARKYSLINNYCQLKERVSTEELPGELRQRFQKTIDANQQASIVLSDYADFCKNHPTDDSAKIQARHNAHEQIAGISHPGISSLYSDCLEILQRIKSLIEYDLLYPFKKVYPISSYSEEDFENDLKSKGIKESSVKNLVSQFSIFRTQFHDWRYKTIKNDKYIVYSGTAKPSQYEYSSYTRKYEVLNNEMRLAISDLMGYNVQLEYKGFVDNLKSVLDSDTQVIIDNINNSGFDVNVASIISLLAIECKIEPEIPEDLFVFADPFHMRADNEERTRVIDGVCCDDYETYDVTVYKVCYPTNDGLYNNWSRGISGSEKGFWDIVVKWVNTTISQQSDKIELAINTVSKDVIDSLTEQKNRLKDGSVRRNLLLDSIEARFNESISVYNNLANNSI